MCSLATDQGCIVAIACGKLAKLLEYGRDILLIVWCGSRMACCRVDRSLRNVSTTAMPCVSLIASNRVHSWFFRKLGGTYF
jgi:hypothetical protein